jgi:hypothetical protein
MLSKNRPDAEFTLLQKLQEAMQKNGKNLRDNFRDIVIPFFKDDTDSEKVNHVKFETFDVGGCQSIIKEDHRVFRDFNTLQPPTIDGPPALASARRPTSQGARPRRPAGQVRPSPSACQAQAQPVGQGAWSVGRAPGRDEERGGKRRRLLCG